MFFMTDIKDFLDQVKNLIKKNTPKDKIQGGKFLYKTI